MKRINNFQECLEYVNRLGLVNRSKPMGWRQANLVEIVARLEAAGPYPLLVKFHRSISGRKATFTVNTSLVRFNYPH